jgi:hypothetical protein
VGPVFQQQPILSNAAAIHHGQQVERSCPVQVGRIRIGSELKDQLDHEQLQILGWIVGHVVIFHFVAMIYNQLKVLVVTFVRRHLSVITTRRTSTHVTVVIEITAAIFILLRRNANLTPVSGAPAQVAIQVVIKVVVLVTPSVTRHCRQVAYFQVTAHVAIHVEAQLAPGVALKVLIEVEAENFFMG